MKRICFVMPFHIIEGRGGGAEVQAWFLAKELARRGYEITYVAESIENRQGRSEVIKGVTIYWIKHFPNIRWMNSWQYYQTLKIVEPDLVVQRMASFTTGVIGLYARCNRKKFAWICSDDSLPFKWAFCKRQVEDSRNKSHHKLKMVILMLNALFHDLSRQAGMRFITYPFTQNGKQQNSLKKSFGLDSYRISSGHDVPEIIASTKERLQQKIILWVGTMGPRKQPWQFVELARKCQKFPWQFVMVGGHADSEYIASFMKPAPPNLNWVGRKEFNEALAWFDKAAVFVNTSRAAGEGFPNTFIQSWLRGVPVVSLEVNPDHVITDQYLGYVTNNIPETAAAIKNLLNDIPLYNHLSQHVINFAKENYTMQRVANHFLDIIRNGVELNHPALQTVKQEDY